MTGLRAMKIIVMNPSDVPRSGHVTMPLGTTKLPDPLLVKQDGEELLTQVDDRLGDDKHRELSFLLHHDVRAGDECYATDCATLDVVKGTQRPKQHNDPEVYDIVLGRGFKMRN